MNWRQVGGRALNVLTKPSACELTEALFLRLLGLIYVAAFGSFLPQIVGLIGSRGIEPAAQTMTAMRTELGSSVFAYVPTLFWFNASDTALVSFCVAGCIAGLSLMIGLLPRI